MGMTLTKSKINATIEILNILARYGCSVSDVDEITTFIRTYASKNTVIANQDFRSKLNYLLEACEEE